MKIAVAGTRYVGLSNATTDGDLAYKRSDLVIVANKYDLPLYDVKDKVYTMDLLKRD